MTEQDKTKAAKQAIEVAVNILSEHFDAVQILGCRLRPDGGTQDIFQGSGLWYARMGMAQEFLERNQNEEMTSRLSNKLAELADRGDDDEEWKDA